MPVLRGRALGAGRRALPLRHLEPPRHDQVLVHRRLPRHRYPLVPRRDLPQRAAHAADHRAGRQRRPPLQPQTALDTKLIRAYDVPPYVNSASQSGSVPFLDIGNRDILAGAQYDPQVLAGLSAAQIAAQLRDPSTPVAKAIDGSARMIIAAINHLLHNPAARS